jgi:hypothetical protein
MWDREARRLPSLCRFVGGPVKRFGWLLLVLGCSSPAAVPQHPAYYIRFAKDVDSIRAPATSFAMTHIVLEAETNIPGWEWAVGSRDTAMTQQGVNWSSASWSSVIGWMDSLDASHLQRISAVNCCSQISGGMAYSDYGTRLEYRGRTDTVIVSAYMRDILISDTISIVIF